MKVLTAEQMARIKPSVKCFDNSLDFLVELAQESVSHTGSEFHDYHLDFPFRLVHASCLHPKTMEWYAHAWVEDLQHNRAWFGVVLDGVVVFIAEQITAYHRKIGVADFTAYTLREAAEENAKHNHYGPWKPEYFKHAVHKRTDAL